MRFILTVVNGILVGINAYFLGMYFWIFLSSGKPVDLGVFSFLLPWFLFLILFSVMSFKLFRQLNFELILLFLVFSFFFLALYLNYMNFNSPPYNFWEDNYYFMPPGPYGIPNAAFYIIYFLSIFLINRFSRKTLL